MEGLRKAAVVAALVFLAYHVLVVMAWERIRAGVFGAPRARSRKRGR